MRKHNTNPVHQYIYPAILIFSLIIFVFFVNPSTFYFLNDDFESLPDYVNGNLFSHGGMRITEKAFTMLDILLYKTQSTGYFFTSIFIHISVCAIAFLWLQKISNSLGILLRQKTAVCISILFMWYAFHTEPLIWIVCRTASLSLFFFLLGWLFILWNPKNKILIWLSLPSFILGIFAYENCWLYPISLTVWWFLLNKESLYKTKKTIIAILCSWLLLAIYFPIRKFIATQWIGNYLSDNIVKLDFKMYLKNTVSLFARSFLPPMQNKNILVIATICIVIILTLLSFYLWKQKKTDKLWSLLLFNWILSYIFFVSLGIDTNGYESERYIYFPSLFLCAWLVYSFSLISIKKPIPEILFITFLLYNIFFLNKSLQAFRNAGNLAKQTITSIQTNLGSKKIYINNLPDKAFGVPIFRFPFNKAIKWFSPNADTTKIIIVSETNFQWKKNVVSFDSIDNKNRNLIINFNSVENNSINP